MAVGHFEYDKNTSNGGLLHSALRDMEEGYSNLVRAVNTFIQAKDGANVTQYAADLFGFVANDDDTAIEVATNALAELESCKGALDGVAATLNQCFNKFRNG